MSYQINSAPSTCLTSLHSGDSLRVLAKCPVSFVEENYVYVSSLGCGRYSVYTQNSTKAKVLRRVLRSFLSKFSALEIPFHVTITGKLDFLTKLYGTHSIDPITLTGLVTVEVRKDCRVVGESFILEPVVDFESVQQVLDSILVTLGTDQNFTSALNWGKETGLVSALPDELGQTMNKIASSWNKDKLKVEHEWSII